MVDKGGNFQKLSENFCSCLWRDKQHRPECGDRERVIKQDEQYGMYSFQTCTICPRHPGQGACDPMLFNINLQMAKLNTLTMKIHQKSKLFTKQSSNICYLWLTLLLAGIQISIQNTKNVALVVKGSMASAILNPAQVGYFEGWEVQLLTLASLDTASTLATTYPRVLE